MNITNNHTSSQSTSSTSQQQPQQQPLLGDQQQQQSELSGEFRRLISQTNQFLTRDLNDYLNNINQPHSEEDETLSPQMEMFLERNAMAAGATGNSILNMQAMTGTNNGANGSQQAVVNLDQQQQPGQQQPNQPGMVNGVMQMEQQPPNNVYAVMIKTLQTSLPFVILLFVKILHQHLIGFFIVLGFMTTLHYSNKTLVFQILLKEKKETYKLALLILFLIINMTVFFLIFDDYKLENCLLFMSPNIPKIDTWNLIWIVACTDTIIKFMVISAKALITLFPLKIIPLRKRGNFYSTIETIGLFYRYLTPIHPWILYLLYPDTVIVQAVDSGANTSTSIMDGSSTIFTIILCLIYLVLKLNQLYNGLNDLARSARELFIDFSYGVPVCISEYEDNVCPICQDKYSNPVILKCKHTFCQDCVCMWLDKENSCPMCRAKILVKKPKFKDGSTSIFVQWF